jgi:cytidine deaminase
MDETTMRMLADAARRAAKAAYAPYSGFKVGAAVLADDGRVFTGCNIENASYGLANCAERTAVFKAVSEGARRLSAITVAGGTDKPATPCGACRQVLAEFCDASTPVRCVTLDGNSVRDFTLGELLPASFSMQPTDEVR